MVVEDLNDLVKTSVVVGVPYACVVFLLVLCSSFLSNLQTCRERSRTLLGGLPPKQNGAWCERRISYLRSKIFGIHYGDAIAREES